MALISGRYGSVQRLLYDAETKTYQTSTFSSSAKFDSGLAARPSDGGSPVDGDGTTVSAVTSWSLENTVNTIPFIASNTRGYQGKLEGVHSATGNIAGLGAIPPVSPGDRFMFLGYTGPENGKIDNFEGCVYSIAAVCNSITININYQLSNPITWQVGWMSDYKIEGDELTQSQNGFWDYTKIPYSTLLPSSKSEHKLEIYSTDDSEVLSDMCLIDANIQFNTDVAQFSSSCSVAETGGTWQQCVVGATNCTMSCNIMSDDYNVTGSLLPGSNHKVKIYTNGGPECASSNVSYWEFYKMMFGTFGGLNVDVTNNSQLQFSCNMEFNAFPDCGAGYIKYDIGDGKARYLVQTGDVD